MKILFCFLFFSIISITAALRGFNGVERGSKKLIRDQQYFETLAPSPSLSPQKVILARRRTQRPDILQGFKRYKGGWDLTNRHYWASVGFTGAVGSISAVLWFFVFGIAIIVRCCWWQGIQVEDVRLLGTCLILLFIVTIASVIGCVSLVVDQAKFNAGLLDTSKYIVNQSTYAVQNLLNVTAYLSQARSITVGNFFIASNVQDEINKLNKEISPAADNLAEKTTTNFIKVKKVFRLIQSVLLAVAAVMAFLSVLGLGLSFCGHNYPIYVLIFGGWLLVTITFILFAVSIIINNAITDTCMSMEEWVDNSQAETALSNILPCVDQQITNKTLIQSKEVINNVVMVVNMAIVYSANNDEGPFPVYYNLSGPFIPRLCSPFDPKLNDNNCGPGEVSFANASTVWQNYVCIPSTSGICMTVGRITPGMYLQLLAAVSVSNALFQYAPHLLGLQNCDFVKDAFTTITSAYCPPLKHEVHMVSVDLCLISTGVLLCMVIWILYGNL